MDGSKKYMNNLESLISQAIADKIFKSRQEAIICASICNPRVMGKLQPDIEDLKNVIKIRTEHKKGIKGLWK